AYDKHYKTPHIPVPMAAAQAYDATYLLLYALFNIGTGEINGPAVKTALEHIDRPYYGVVTTYDRPFSPDDKDAITRNMLVMGVVKSGAVTYAYPSDARSSGIIQRKQ
ncbi:MAG: ABC transporter substrate-binding protein, partial [Betaproteobacteria bacterium]|nr:ABC transporter substrate-binding protein [Betaproteobacteria bacterium]